MTASTEFNPRILIAGGGTGGHLYPAIAIQEAVLSRAPNAEIEFVGTKQGIESKILPKKKLILNHLWISGLKRGSPLQNLATVLKLGVSLLQSARLIKRFKPHLVIGTGGYVMGPVLYMAQRKGIPTLLQEQNSFPGLTTRKLAPKADAVCVAFPHAARLMKTKRIEITGNPVRSGFQSIEKSEALKSYSLDPARPTLLFVGGSQGARSINLAVADALQELLKRFNIIWQTGKFGVPEAASPSVIESETARHHLRILPFIDDMQTAYAASDLAICRAGAMTIAELAICRLPAVFIPFPFATDDHQTANAKSLCDAGAASLIADRDLTSAVMIKEINRIFENKIIGDMRTAITAFAQPEAADHIAEIALSLIHK